MSGNKTYAWEGMRENMVNKKIVIIATILAIVIVGAIVGYGITSLQKAEYTFNDKVADNDNNTVVDEGKYTINNTIDENVTDSNVVDENTTEQNIISTELNNSTASETSEDKAKTLAKKKWGEEDKSVYYYVEEQLSQNVYVVSVRSQETTADLIDYEVNIETEEVTEY